MTSVLVVDDQTDVREALGALVESEPTLTLAAAAADAGEAIHLAELHRPDIALVDFKMPGGGPHAIREILARSPQTRVIALSAYADRSSVFQMLEAGAIGYLVKGSTEADVREAIEHALVGQSAISPEVGAEMVRGLTDHLENESQRQEEQRSRRARVAAALEPGAIELAFQPLVLLASREVVGYEALARFTLEPQQAPDRWFADAEAVGLGVELEAAVLDAAAAAMQLLPPETLVGVNVSPTALLSEHVQQKLLLFDLPRLRIEITEHVRVADYDALLVALEPLRAKGALVVIDDVGAGYASLSHILRLQPDVIKLDASVVAEVETDGARAMTAALVTFAAELGIRVVAEGIESESAAILLHQLGIAYGQGFYLGGPRPLPV